MTETTSTSIKIGAAVVMTVVLVSICIMLFLLGADSAKSATTDLNSTTMEMKDHKYLIYDNTIISGSQVISAIRKFQAQAEQSEIALQVITGKDSSSGTWYYARYVYGDVVTDGAERKLEKALDPTRDQYINPTGTFNASITRDANGVIRAIHFEQRVHN